jgi:glycosyltransferase involved in cell wall biosynthesis
MRTRVLIRQHPVPYRHASLTPLSLAQVPLVADDTIGLHTPDVFIVPSEFAKGRVLEGRGGGGVEIVYPGADDSLAGLERDEGGGEVLIASVMRLDPDKSPWLLARTIANVCARKSDVVFEIAGDGLLRSMFEELVAELGAQQCVRMLGPLSRGGVASLLRRADVFLNPSVYNQTWGIANLEAMLAGVPLVAFPAGGGAEYVRPQKTLVDERASEREQRPSAPTS